MRFLFSLLLGFSLSLGVSATQLSFSKERADSAYQAQNYAEAITQYEAIVKEFPSADIYYNMGNAHFRQKKMGKAVLAYERALRLSPEHQDARNNLALVRSRLTDRFSSNASILSKSLFGIINKKSVSLWVAWSLVGAIATILFALLYRVSIHIWLQKTGFYGALAAFSLFLICTTFALIQRNAFYNNTRAVIIATSVQSFSSPTESSSRTRLLHEGTTIDILEQSGKDWIQVELPDGHVVWLKKDAIEKIVTEL